jgi:hypothetical protein
VRVHHSFQRLHETIITICRLCNVDYIFTKSVDNLIAYGHGVSIRGRGFELRPESRAPKERREPVVQPPISRMKEVALEAHLVGYVGSGPYGGNGGGHGRRGACRSREGTWTPHYVNEL